VGIFVPTKVVVARRPQTGLALPDMRLLTASHALFSLPLVTHQKGVKGVESTPIHGLEQE
jgi:hypothetical protein